MKSKVRRTWAAWLERFQRSRRTRAGTGPDGHPTPELLSAYHDDQLSPEKDEEIQEHFVDCPECPELMLDLDQFTSPQAVEAAQADLSDTWVDGAWRRLRSRLAAEPRSARPAVRWLRSPAPAWCMTVLLVPCTLFLGLRVNTLGGELRELESPRLNPLSMKVEPKPVLRGGDPPPPELVVPAGVRQFILVFTPSTAPPHLEYDLKIWNEQGKDIWSQRGLRKSVDGDFAVGLSRRSLPAGLYTFQVIGITGPEIIEPFEEEFPLRLTYL